MGLCLSIHSPQSVHCLLQLHVMKYINQLFTIYQGVHITYFKTSLYQQQPNSFAQNIFTFLTKAQKASLNKLVRRIQVSIIPSYSTGKLHMGGILKEFNALEPLTHPIQSQSFIQFIVRAQLLIYFITQSWGSTITYIDRVRLKHNLIKRPQVKALFTPFT